MTEPVTNDTGESFVGRGHRVERGRSEQATARGREARGAIPAVRGRNAGQGTSAGGQHRAGTARSGAAEAGAAGGHAEAVKRRLAGGMLAEPSQRRGVAMRDRLLVRGVSSARVRRAPGLQRPETRLGHAAAGVQAGHDGVRRNGFGQCWSGHAPLGTLSTAHSPSTLRTVPNRLCGRLMELRIQSGRQSKNLESL